MGNSVFHLYFALVFTKQVPTLIIHPSGIPTADRISVACMHTATWFFIHKLTKKSVYKFCFPWIFYMTFLCWCFVTFWSLAYSMIFSHCFLSKWSLFWLRITISFEYLPTEWLMCTILFLPIAERLISMHKFYLENDNETLFKFLCCLVHLFKKDMMLTILHWINFKH